MDRRFHPYDVPPGHNGQVFAWPYQQLPRPPPPARRPVKEEVKEFLVACDMMHLLDTFSENGIATIDTLKLVIHNHEFRVLLTMGDCAVIEHALGECRPPPRPFRLQAAAPSRCADQPVSG